jgi:hypothetical protein
MSSLLRAAVFAFSALVLISCAAGGKVRTVGYRYPYDPSTARNFAQWAGSGGPILVELRNNPFPNPPEQVAPIIAEAASNAAVLPGDRFTANPNEAWHPDWRVVFAFNVPQALQLAPICDPRLPLPATQSGGDWYAAVVFCNEWRPITAAGAWSVPIPDPNSKDFRDFVGQAIYAMLPREGFGADNADEMRMRR